LLGKTDDPSADSMRQRIPTSALTLAGLLKHLALVEDDWIQFRFLGRPEREPWASAHGSKTETGSSTPPSTRISMSCAPSSELRATAAAKR